MSKCGYFGEFVKVKRRPRLRGASVFGVPVKRGQKKLRV